MIEGMTSGKCLGDARRTAIVGSCVLASHRHSFQ